LEVRGSKVSRSHLCAPENSNAFFWWTPIWWIHCASVFRRPVTRFASKSTGAINALSRRELAYLFPKCGLGPSTIAPNTASCLYWQGCLPRRKVAQAGRLRTRRSIVATALRRRAPVSNTGGAPRHSEAATAVSPSLRLSFSLLSRHKRKISHPRRSEAANLLLQRSK